ncbi:MAG: hypothetical protein IJD54_03605 [Clostridia bacterium]|nr:hypothetical protein [Clostridia bacterium]
MKKKKAPTSAYRKLVNIFKSRVTRGAVIMVMLCLSVLGMFMLDEQNFIRREYLTFLESNFIADFMTFFKISKFNIMLNAWVLFIVFFFVAIVMTIGNMCSYGVMKNSKNKAVTGIVYYFTLLVICAAIVFVAYMLGAFDTFDRGTAGVFINLVYSLILCLGFIILIPILLVALYYLIKLVGYLLALFVTTIRGFSKDIIREEKVYRLQREEEEEYEEEIFIGSPTAPERVFPSLVKIDNAPLETVENPEDIDLESLCLQFQSYACNNHKIYYDLPLIRSFIAGLATSRLIILEGLSGTGKSMLPRMFAKFTNSNAFFAPVQATWRDKSDVLGFYSEFSKTFKPTPFLENLYAASYSEKTNVMVLDEMNLSRIEYYFADFLSVMEYPAEDWKIRIYDPQNNQRLPKKLDDGCVSVPTNTYFVGTANTDDSTFTVTDKVYDRAVVIDFDEKVKPIETSYKSDSINISAEGLQNLFNKAINDESLRLTQKETDKFLKICDFMKDAFDVRFGNRIMVQIETFVPVYVALGGTKEEALDFMFARKILRKVDGMYEDFVKDELANLTKLITTSYGKNVFTETETMIAKFTKRLV